MKEEYNRGSKNGAVDMDMSVSILAHLFAYTILGHPLLDGKVFLF
jgi:hypothetical protein